MKKLHFISVSLAILLTLTGCLASSTVKLGQLEAGLYRAQTNAFTVSIPEGAAVNDGTHPLGGFMTLKNLPNQIDLQGVSYNRTANTQNMSGSAAKDMIKSSHDFWAKTYSSSPLNVTHEEWITIDGKPAYFTVSNAGKSGLLVEPNVFFGSLSFMRGNQTYVLFDRVTTSKRLLGSKTEPAEASASTRQKALKSFYRTVKFF